MTFFESILLAFVILNVAGKNQKNLSTLVRDKRTVLLDNTPLVSCFVDLRLASGTASAEEKIGKIMKSKILALTNTEPDEDTVQFNVEIIQKYINNNFDENNPLKLRIIKDSSELKDVIHFSKDGFQCNPEFCEKNGSGIYGFGICSPYSCSCDINGAQAKKCKDNLIFDPVYESCDIPTKIRICGM